MTESQQSICDWADATFGAPFSDVSIAAYALVHMARLVSACAHRQPAESIGEEIADVVIVLARLGRSLDADVVGLIGNNGLRPSWHTATWHAFNASEHLSNCAKHIDDTWRLAGLRWCVGALAALARDIDVDLTAAIDRKMTVNRARKWRVDGNGHGVHVKEGQ